MTSTIVEYVNFYFPTYKTQFYCDNFIKACLVYQFLYAKYFTQKMDIGKIIYRLSGDKYSLRSNSPTLTNHLIFTLAFKTFWKDYRIGRRYVYIFKSPIESEVIGYLTGIVYWIFHRGVVE